MSDQIVVRLYNQRDLPAVVALWEQCFGEPEPHNDYRAAIDRKEAVGDELFYVAELVGTIVGTAIGGYDGHRGWAYSVAVKPDHRRLGVGRLLMRKLESDLRARGCNKLNLQVRDGNSTAVTFYEKLGFNVEKRVSMGKKLD